MTTPEEAVRVAREAVMETMLLGYGPDGDEADPELARAYYSTENDKEIDALLTAERARLAARVEGMRKDESVTHHRDCGFVQFDGRRECDCGGWQRSLDACVFNHARDAVLALLREPA